MKIPPCNADTNAVSYTHLPDDIVLILYKQVIYLTDRSCGGIFNRKHGKIRCPILDRIHRILPRTDMVAVDRIPKVLL